MGSTDFTHAELVDVARRWLYGTRKCSVVATERNCRRADEAPDAKEDQRMSRAEAETSPDEVAVVRRLADGLGGAERLAVVSVLAELLRLRRDGGRLGDEVQALIQRKVIDVRSPAGDALLDFRDPPRTERGDRLAALEERMDAMRGVGNAWPLADVLERLASAADHLLAAHDYDGHGWEEVRGCAERARTYAKEAR